jgi:PAS domain S-box-containing protein
MSTAQSTIAFLPAGGTRVQELLAALPVAAYTCDADGCLTFFNERAAELWGRRPNLNDTSERYCGSLTLLSVDGAQMPHETSWMALTLRTGTMYEGRGVVILRPDGSRRRVLASVSPLYDDAGTVVGAASLLTDITGQMQSEAPDFTVDVTEEKAAGRRCKRVKPISGASSTALPSVLCKWARMVGSCGSTIATARSPAIAARSC